jgi:hypothetical protein
MPITYVIDPQAGIQFSRWSGDILPSDLASHWAILNEDQNAQEVSLVLADLREANLDFTGAEFWKAVDDHFREAIAVRSFKNAVLVANVHQELAAKRWISIAPKTVVARVFWDEDQAKTWLKSGQEAEAEQ